MKKRGSSKPMVKRIKSALLHGKCGKAATMIKKLAKRPNPPKKTISALSRGVAACKTAKRPFRYRRGTRLYARPISIRRTRKMFF